VKENCSDTEKNSHLMLRNNFEIQLDEPNTPISKINEVKSNKQLETANKIKDLFGNIIMLIMMFQIKFIKFFRN
jgi:hypothetical protein